MPLWLRKLCVFIIVCCVAVAASLFLPKLRRPTPPKPEDAIWSMFQASRDGDAEQYLAIFCEELEATMRRTAREMGKKEFSNYLRHRMEPIVGIAVTPEKDPPPTETFAAMKIELVYKEKNEAQLCHLKKVGKEWKVSRLGESKEIKPPVPYGTKVYEEEAQPASSPTSEELQTAK